MKYINIKHWVYVLLLVLCNCSSDKEEQLNTLASAIEGKQVVLDNVIACAASSKEAGLVDVFLYPRTSVSNIQFYETVNAEVDKNDFSEYSLGNAPLIDVFNGYLLKFEAAFLEEKWVVVSFEEEGKIHISNPIRLKQKTKPTEYIDSNVAIDKTEALMPKFSWVDGVYDDTKIYFEVVSDAQDEFISGTYTFEKEFQYYKLDNVVLNITNGEPPVLVSGSSYNFSLLAVSEDNWVNLFSAVPFSID